MDSNHSSSRFSHALTQAVLGKLPPDIHVAAGHDDEVMLFLLRVGNAEETTRILMAAITLSEADCIIELLKQTGGLIKKKFPIDVAQQLKDKLESVDTEVEFVRPDSDVTRQD